MLFVFGEGLYVDHDGEIGVFCGIENRRVFDVLGLENWNGWGKLGWFGKDCKTVGDVFVWEYI